MTAMTLADLLERLLLRESDLSPEELYERLGSSRSKARSPAVIRTVLSANADRFVQCSPGRFASTKRVITDDNDDEQPEWQSLEFDLRSQLRGRRMVSEVGLDARLFTQVEEALSSIIRPSTDPMVVADQARALLAVCLVSHGIYRYQAGSYWSGFGVPAIDHSYGKAFARSVHLLELESFEDMVADDNAVRFVAPILAHGGIPKYCLEDFFTLVSHGLRQGAADATDLLTLWRTRRAAFANIDKPVRRFLLFGGDLSRDFLDRCVDVIREWAASGTIASPDDAGLPAYVLSAFRQLTKTGAINSAAVGRRIANTQSLRPSLLCDPWDTIGPCVVLPRVVNASQGAVWTVSTPSGIRREKASATADRSLPVDPERQWEVRLTSDQEVVGETTFEGIDSMPALFFDSQSNAHVPPGLGLRGSDVMVLRAPDKQVEVLRAGVVGDPVILEQLPEPTGAWSGFCLERIDLTGCTALMVGSGNQQRRISVRSFDRPTLQGTELSGALGGDGSKILTANPAVRLPSSAVPWLIKVGVDGDVHTFQQDGDSDAGLKDLLPTDRAAQVTLLVRASLGSDLRASFIWVPDLSISRPERLTLPGGPPPVVTVISPLVTPLNAKVGQPLTLTPADNSDSVDLRFPSKGSPIDVRVQLPLLRWGLVRDGKCELAMTETRLTTLDFESGNALGLAVSTGARDVAIQLSISSHGTELQRSDKALAGGSRSQCRFDLGRFSDTLSRLDERADLTLLVGPANVPVRVGTVLPDYEFTNLTAAAVRIGEHASVEISFTERRQVKGRVARLWSTTRIWDDPLVAPIPEAATGNAVLPLDPAPPAGTYLVEVTVDDGFATPTRPNETDPGVVRVQFGDADAALIALDERADFDPSAVIESIVLRGYPIRHLETHEIVDALRPALISWVTLSRSTSSTAFTERALYPLLHVVLLGRSDLPSLIDELAGDDVITAADLLHLAVALAPLLAPGKGGPQLETARVIWQLEPALGALLEFGLDQLQDSTNSTEFLGWAMADQIESIEVGEPIEQRWLGMELDQLEMIRSIIQFDLLPRTLTVDGRIDATLEWLRADKAQGGGVAAEWRNTHHELLNQPIPASEAVRSHLSARSVPHGTEVWGGFPQLTLVAALHACGRTDTTVPAQRALIDAARFAPLQVRRDLIIARALVLDILQSNDDDVPSTERMT